MEPAVLPGSAPVSVASKYVGSPAHDGHFIKPAMTVPALSDGGYSTTAEKVKGEFMYYPPGGMWACQRVNEMAWHG